MTVDGRRKLKEMGIVDFAIHSADYVARSISPKLGLVKYYVVAQPVPERRLLDASRGQKVEVRQVTWDDPVLEQFLPSEEEIAERFRRGGVAFAAFRKDRLTGYIWLIAGPYREPVERCEFFPAPEDKAVWDLDVYIDPAERLGLTFARLWDEAYEYLRARGFEWTVSRIAASNRGSIAAHRRLGLRVIGRILFLKAGSWQLSLASIRPYVYFSRDPATLPKFVVRAPE